MKKLILIFMGVAMALASCKTQSDGLASAGVDDVYYNPTTDRKPNVVPKPEQYTAKQVQDPNAGKIAATEADKNNPYYQDPNFNYDDYYDNAYAARIRRFNNPIYGTGYYDTYNTNSYFYNGNPNCYGNSIYSSYNMGYGGSSYYNGGGYYSPSNSFWNAYYNPYYNGFNSPYGGYGNGWNMSYGIGYGNGCGGNGYNPYGMGYGYGGYNPYSYGGYGYNPYSPYGGYGYSSPMTSGGYYNSYDYNSGSYSHYGPRGSHTGGNSTTSSPVVGPHHLAVSKPQIEGTPGSSPYSEQRFNQVALPKDHFTKIQESKNPITNSPMYSPANTNSGGGRPAYNSGAGNTNGSTGVSGNDPSYNNYGGGVKNNPVYTAPQNNGTTEPGESRPKKWNFSSGNGGGSNTNTNSSPSNNNWGGHSTGSGSAVKGGASSGDNGGGSNSGGSSSGGSVARPRK